MRMIQEIEIAGRKVQVKEITVGEARKLLVGADAEPNVDGIAWLLFEDCSLNQIAAMSDLSKSEIDGFTPSQLRLLADAVKKANPLFFAMMERAARIASQLAPETLNASVASS